MIMIMIMIDQGRSVITVDIGHDDLNHHLHHEGRIDQYPVIFTSVLTHDQASDQVSFLPFLCPLESHNEAYISLNPFGDK